MGYLEDRFLRKSGVLPPLPTKKERKPIAKKSAKKIAEEKAVRVEGEDTELQKWYAAIMEREEGRCWETGERIDKRSRQELVSAYPDLSSKEIDELVKKVNFGWHGSVAHCLPKSLFPSVATHPLNYMILKMWGGTHGNYDASWERAAKMKVWPHAVKIINILYPLLTSEEKKRIRGIEVIAQEIKPENF